MKKIYTITALLIASLLLVHCNDKPKETPAAAEPEVPANIVEINPEQFKSADIQFGMVELKALSGTTKVNGMLDVPPQNLVSISTPFGGFVKSTAMLQGMKVRKGQVVAMMQNPDYVQPQQDYIDLKSQLNYLKQDYERQQELSKENVNALKTLQKSKAEYESMRARVAGLKTKLQLMNINISSLENGTIQSTIPLYSPIDGYVTEVNTNIGAYANATDVLFEIADTGHLHAELTVFEKDVPKLQIGQKVRFTLANETTERMATVYLVGKEISAERTVQIHCHLDKEDKNLLPGMYLKALVESGTQQVPAVPSTAVVEFQGSKYIFIENNEGKADKKTMQYKLMNVKVGVTELNYTELILEESADYTNWKIVTNGAYELLSKMKNSEEEE
ncbi:MAG: efflux transporter periplasmic adaptor subunit [Flavobacterium sp. BFFFF1]|uniref:efflux RND transporter periplasmic adaptor subunit n=1 Tax=Flavobacterium sp. BFFFF1 TaxID=2015557 RepID=UPI000BC65C90|nr:efflux RND transporter periplasmic adaptor subunit [Flavobacterium sp. BFFFF1]OYU80697.1 MAG: efflux transporter periplasmic adaptor subunit [Flavobacterium sp. BFFFF1]